LETRSQREGGILTGWKVSLREPWRAPQNKAHIYDVAPK